MNDNIEKNDEQTEEETGLDWYFRFDREFRPLSEKELKKVLDKHNEWIKSNGKRGELIGLDRPDVLRMACKHYGEREEVLNSVKCGCFRCLQIFSPDEIDEWHAEDQNGVGQIPICPKCGIDSLIGDASGFPVEPKFLSKMEEFAFSGISNLKSKVESAIEEKKKQRNEK